MNKAPLLTENKIKAAADINCASAVLFQLIIQYWKIRQQCQEEEVCLIFLLVKVFKLHSCSTRSTLNFRPVAQRAFKLLACISDVAYICHLPIWGKQNVQFIHAQSCQKTTQKHPFSILPLLSETIPKPISTIRE